MRVPGIVAWAGLAASIAVGSVSQEAAERAPAFQDGWRVLSADFHVHAFPGDGALPPWDLRREARRRGLDIVALTNHNQMVAARLDRVLFPEPPPPLVLAAEELTAFGYHLTAIGIHEPIDWRLPLAGAVRAVHAQGGIAIVAHAVSRFGDQIDDESLALLDGIEVAHPVVHIKPTARAQLDALYARALRIKPAIAAIGASDFHFTAPMGTCRTLIFARDLSQASVLDAIRAGRTVAVDRAGRAFGPPRWTSAAASHAAAALPAPPSNGWNLASVALAWASLVALVACRRGD